MCFIRLAFIWGLFIGGNDRGGRDGFRHPLVAVPFHYDLDFAAALAGDFSDGLDCADLFGVGGGGEGGNGEATFTERDRLIILEGGGVEFIFESARRGEAGGRNRHAPISTEVVAGGNVEVRSVLTEDAAEDFGDICGDAAEERGERVTLPRFEGA